MTLPASTVPAVLARLGPLQVQARKVMEGVLTGLHKSRHHGQSVEFSEHKEYAPGDEIRHIDWRAFAKLDKYYVKRFEMETNLRALLVLDASGSMAYGRGAMTKLQYAAVCAGAPWWPEMLHAMVRASSEETVCPTMNRQFVGSSIPG